MEKNLFYDGQTTLTTSLRVGIGIILSLFFGWLIAVAGMPVATLLVISPFVISYLIIAFIQPRISLLTFLVYCFLNSTLGKHIEGVQFGLGQDGLLLLAWLGIIFHRSGRYRLRHLNNSLVWMAVAWFAITIMQIVNPDKPSIEGWFYEMRSASLYWVLTIPLVFMVFNKKGDINLFLNIIILLSVAGALYGAKQLFFGVDAAENRWLEAGAKKTHMLFGKLRIFSYYSEAGQFGASQATIAAVAIILALGPYTRTKKCWYAIAGLLLFYGMLLSGTRGALFGLVGGLFIYLLLSKKGSILIAGALCGMLFFSILKYTHIGSGNQQISRLRTSLDPNDASFLVRLSNQAILRDYLSNKPFGAGVGTIGTWGLKYNPTKFISTIPPDSMFVKIWAMYGIVGFIIWFGIMLYILGKSIGIIWQTRDAVLRNQLTALCAGSTGILLCSYGNEVLNTMPSSAIVYVSWALIWMSPRWDDKPVPKISLP